jgi:hypothetical protein
VLNTQPLDTNCPVLFHGTESNRFDAAITIYIFLLEEAGSNLDRITLILSDLFLWH